jgi:hypothetical protein
MYDDFEMGDIQIASSGLDSFLDDTVIEDASDMRRVASLDDLVGFERVSSNTLVRKPDRDLWALSQTEDGEWVIKRVFDDDGNPITM